MSTSLLDIRKVLTGVDCKLEHYKTSDRCEVAYGSQQERQSSSRLLEAIGVNQRSTNIRYSGTHRYTAEYSINK